MRSRTICWQDHTPKLTKVRTPRSRWNTKARHSKYSFAFNARL